MLAQDLRSTRNRTANEVLRMRSRALRTRRKYLARLRTLPEPLGGLCADFYEQRVNRVRPKPLLGEYLPWMLGDLCGIPETRVARVAEAWLPAYLHVLAIDDLLDQTADVDRATLPIVSSVFAEQAFVSYALLFGSDERFWSRFEAFFFRTGAAGAREIVLARGRVSSVSPTELRRAGEKIDVVKVCYVSLALANGVDPEERHLAALEDFAVGIQLFDDISDWEEDFAIGSFTPLLALGFRDANDAERSNRAGDRRHVLARLVVSGALKQCLSEGEERLARSAAAAGFHDRSSGMRFVRSLIADLRSLRREDKAVAVLIDDARRQFGEVELDELVKRSARVRSALERFIGKIQVVAQSS